MRKSEIHISLPICSCITQSVCMAPYEVRGGTVVNMWTVFEMTCLSTVNACLHMGRLAQQYYMHTHKQDQASQAAWTID